MNKKAEKELKVTFGQHLRRLRLDRGLSMRGFADLADIDYSQIVKIENGIISPTTLTVYKIAEALNISLKDLFDFKYPSQVK